MRKKIVCALMVLVGCSLAAGPGNTAAQETPKTAATASEAPTKVPLIYRLDFLVRELEDGKRINSRSYSLFAKNHERAVVRVGSLVPTYPYEGQGGDKGIQYQNSGISIDCTPMEMESEVLLSTTFESTNVVPLEKAAAELGGSRLIAPVIRQVRFQGTARVTPGKPTVISTLDDVATNHRYEVEVTATKVK